MLKIYNLIMKNRFDINKEEVLNLHRKHKTEKMILREQSGDVNAQLQSMVDNGQVPGAIKVVEMDSDNPNHKWAIKKESKQKPGTFVYLFLDRSYGYFGVDGFTFGEGVWTPKNVIKKEVETVQTPDQNKPKEKPLNANQLKVLDLIKNSGWFHDPAPTDVEVDNGSYDKENIVDATTDLGEKYSKYFIQDFPKEFFVYKKTNISPQKLDRAKKVEITAESCQVAIKSLWDHLENPNNFILSAEEIQSYKKTAEICAEPINRGKFILRPELKSKLKDLSNSWIRVRSRL